jgi:hypothetical protein
MINFVVMLIGRRAFSISCLAFLLYPQQSGRHAEASPSSQLHVNQVQACPGRTHHSQTKKKAILHSSSDQLSRYSLSVPRVDLCLIPREGRPSETVDDWNM